jgi:very-short-patch-repair endonuclease
LLLRVEWNHDFEYVTDEGLSLDMAQPNSKLVAEFDGPWHYMTDISGRLGFLNGIFLFKQRLLKSLGWKVLRVPYFEWDGLRSST